MELNSTLRWFKLVAICSQSQVWSSTTRQTAATEINTFLFRP